MCLCMCACALCVLSHSHGRPVCICGRVEDECHFHATSAGNNLAPSFHLAAAAARYFFYSLLSGCFTRFACLSLLGSGSNSNSNSNTSNSNSCWHCVAASAVAVVQVVIVFHFYNHFYVLELLMGFGS